MKQWATRGNDIVYGRQVSDGPALVQRQEHMLETAPGDLGSDPEWGIGIRQYKGRTTALTDIRTLADVFAGQHSRDPETASAQVSVEFGGTNLAYDARFTAESGEPANLALVIE